MFESINIDLLMNPTLVYPALFILLFLNGLTNLPSSQIVYLTFGYFLTRYPQFFALGIILGTVGNTIGNYILHNIVSKHHDFLNSKLAKLMGIRKDLLGIFMDKVNKKGTVWLIVGKVTPSIKVLVPVVTGLSKVSKGKAVAIFFLGSLVWACVVTYLGYYFGKSASLVQFYIIVTCIYFVIGLYGYFKLKNRKAS